MEACWSPGQSPGVPEPLPRLSPRTPLRSASSAPRRRGSRRSWSWRRPGQQPRSRQESCGLACGRRSGRLWTPSSSSRSYADR
ncbi:hypothetical protein Celaphus_00002840 [Cervus elaphus hippelaphus]|uniref:Uncharacterized protein n=1 Tax=Cervus elaphus hippelaphus TaxID=46360 RepID=A0A212CGZ4_CEREH|nr:hypothetical protein Celaphus_00002840 [Cervus elaphus hippelaphus]